MPRYRIICHFASLETQQVTRWLRYIFPEDWGDEKKKLILSACPVIHLPRLATEEELNQLRAHLSPYVDKVEIELLPDEE